jgi:hypothetical protein
MKHVLWVVLLVAVLCVLGCGGSHSSTTEPSSAPIIANLKVFSFIRNDATSGEIPLSFDYADTDGDVSQVLVTDPLGTATNPAQGVTGKTSGNIGILQAVHLSDANVHQLTFSVQVADSAGHHSNTLQGQIAIP